VRVRVTLSHTQAGVLSPVRGQGEQAQVLSSRQQAVLFDEAQCDAVFLRCGHTTPSISAGSGSGSGGGCGEAAVGSPSELGAPIDGEGRKRTKGQQTRLLRLG
jgi:hypothetical protein